MTGPARDNHTHDGAWRERATAVRLRTDGKTLRAWLLAFSWCRAPTEGTTRGHVGACGPLRHGRRSEAARATARLPASEKKLVYCTYVQYHKGTDDAVCGATP